MTSNHFTKPETKTESAIKRTSNKRNKIKIKTASTHEIIESIDEFLDEILQKNNM